MLRITRLIAFVFSGLLAGIYLEARAMANARVSLDTLPLSRSNKLCIRTK